ncbi:MAG: replication protein P [Porticoccaceae bacterium]|nr:replication protein P [Porticoccaceae bacterium]
MESSRDLIQKVASEIATSSTRSQTEAGHPENGPDKPELIDAINQVFALFQINYHNQYFSAFGDNTKSENLAKNLWLNKLSRFSPETICGAAEKIIAENDYLPTLHKMLEACRKVGMPKGLPSPRRAYREACNKPSPKAAQHWSHAAVYLAGRDCGWHTLANEIERKAFPMFEEAYLQYCDRVLSGEQFSVEPPPGLPETSAVTASREYSRKQLNKLKQLMD